MGNGGRDSSAIKTTLFFLTLSSLAFSFTTRNDTLEAKNLFKGDTAALRIRDIQVKQHLTIDSVKGSVVVTDANGKAIKVADGANNQVLQTDGAGHYSFGDKTGGSAGTISSINGSSEAAQTIAAGTGLSVTESGTGNCVHTVAAASGYTIPTGTGGKPDSCIRSDTTEKFGSIGGHGKADSSAEADTAIYASELGGSTLVQVLANDTAGNGALAASIAGKEPTITAGATSQYWRGDKSWQTLNMAAVPYLIDTLNARMKSSPANMPTSGYLLRSDGLNWAGKANVYDSMGDNQNLIRLGTGSTKGGGTPKDSAFFYGGIKAYHFYGEVDSADLLDGQHGSYYAPAAHGVTAGYWALATTSTAFGNGSLRQTADSIVAERKVALQHGFNSTDSSHQKAALKVDGGLYGQLGYFWCPANANQSGLFLRAPSVTGAGSQPALIFQRFNTGTLSTESRIYSNDGDLWFSTGSGTSPSDRGYMSKAGIFNWYGRIISPSDSTRILIADTIKIGNMIIIHASGTLAVDGTIEIANSGSSSCYMGSGSFGFRETSGADTQYSYECNLNILRSSNCQGAGAVDIVTGLAANFEGSYTNGALNLISAGGGECSGNARLSLLNKRTTIVKYRIELRIEPGF